MPGADVAGPASVSSVTFWAAEVWLVTIMRTGPAPNVAGETDTPLSLTDAVMTIGDAGRGSFL